MSTYMKKSTSEIINVVSYSTPPPPQNAKRSDSQPHHTRHAYSRNNSTDLGRTEEKEYNYSRFNMESIFHIEYDQEGSSRCPKCGCVLIKDAKTHRLVESRFPNTQDSPTNLQRKLTVMSGIFKVKYTQDKNNPDLKSDKNSQGGIKRVKGECSETPLIVLRESSRFLKTNLPSHRSMIEDCNIPPLSHNDCQDGTREKEECDEPLIIRGSSTSCRTNLPSLKNTRDLYIPHIKSCSETFPDIESEYFVRSTEYSFRNKLEDDLKLELLKEYIKCKQKRYHIHTYSSSSKEILNESDEFSNKANDPIGLTGIQCCMQTNTSSGKVTKSKNKVGQTALDLMQTCCDCVCKCGKHKSGKSKSAKSGDPDSATQSKEASNKQSRKKKQGKSESQSNEASKQSIKKKQGKSESSKKSEDPDLTTQSNEASNKQSSKKKQGKSKSPKKSEDPDPTTLPNDASNKSSKTESNKAPSGEKLNDEEASGRDKENEFNEPLNEEANVGSNYNGKEVSQHEGIKLEKPIKAKKTVTMEEKPRAKSMSELTSPNDPEKRDASTDAKPEQDLKDQEAQTTENLKTDTQDITDSNQIMDQQDIVIDNPTSIVIKGGRVLVGNDRTTLNETKGGNLEKKQAIEPSEQKKHDESEIERNKQTERKKQYYGCGKSNKRNTCDKNCQVICGNESFCDCPDISQADIIDMARSANQAVSPQQNSYNSESCQCQLMEHTITSESQTESVGDREYQPKKRVEHVNKLIQSVCNHSPPCKQIPGCFLRENVDFLNYCAHVPGRAQVSLFVCKKSRNGVVSSMPLTNCLSIPMANFEKKTSTHIRRVLTPETVQIMRVPSPIMAVQTSEEEVTLTSTDDQFSDTEPELTSPVQPIARAICYRSRLSSNFRIVTRKALFWRLLSRIFRKRKRR